MVTRRAIAVLVVAGVAVLIAGTAYIYRSAPAATPVAPPAAREVRVVASVQPARGLVEPLLAGAGVTYRLDALIPPGVSEHGYEAPPSKLAALDQADVVVLVGLGLEPQIEKFIREHPRAQRRVVVLADVVGMGGADDHGHDHDHDHAHDHDHDHGHDHDHHHHHATDPHIWLDPVLAEKMMVGIADALRDAVKAAGYDGKATESMRRAEQTALARVRDLGDRYQRTIGAAPRKTIVVGHDAWGHLARRYGLTTVAINGLAAQDPTPAALDAAAAAVREHKLKVVFVEPQLGDAAGRRIAEATGASIRTLDPLGQGDWFAMMESNLAAIAEAIGVPVASAAKPPPAPAGTPTGAAVGEGSR